MAASLYELLSKSAVGDNEALLQVIHQFKPQLKNYARRLSTSDFNEAYDALLCKFIELCKKIDMTKIQSTTESSLASYIRSCIINIYKTLLGNIKKDQSDPINMNPYEDSDYIDLWDKLAPVEDQYWEIEYDFLYSILTDYEAKIIVMYFIHRFQVKEIAKFFSVAPPAISQAKTRALKNLKKYYQNEYGGD